mmetsp:Transcript_27425/g.88567  ORF Transcript_27425/g.88567 Transcript_27425/m.88567 type:complete len:203 (-) Transcript_27425:1552-2160(-)
MRAAALASWTARSTSRWRSRFLASRSSTCFARAATATWWGVSATSARRRASSASSAAARASALAAASFSRRRSRSLEACFSASARASSALRRASFASVRAVSRSAACTFIDLRASSASARRFWPSSSSRRSAWLRCISAALSSSRRRLISVSRSISISSALTSKGFSRRVFFFVTTTAGFSASSSIEPLLLSFEAERAALIL